MPNTAPTLTGFAPTLSLTENAAPQLLDADVTFADPDGNFDGGSLTLSGLRAEDRAAIRNQGPGAGQIGVSGADVSYGGVVIGTFSGGVGGTLTVTFNAAATSAAIEALIENLTYANVSDTPIAERTLLLNITDSDGADLGPSPAMPHFTELVGALNPFADFNNAPFSRLSRTNPSFVDLDGDGDLDMVTGDFGGLLTTAANIGDDGDADSFDDFVRLTGTQNPFRDAPANAESAPYFLDLDHDGDLDAVVGRGVGVVDLFENIGDDADSDSYANFIAAPTPFPGLDVGFGAIPAFADLDDDGDMDAVVGNADGILRAFENVGDGADADGFDDFVELSGAANPFDGLDVGFKSAPTFVDLDGDGDLDAVVGEYYGTLRAFENAGDGDDPGAFVDFIELTGANNPFAGMNFGFVIRPSFVDLDGDGFLDLVVGIADFDNTLRSFLNVPGRGAAIQIEVAATNDAPTLTGLATSVTVPGTAAALVVDGSVGFADADVFFGSGTLTVSGLLSEDLVAIRNEGTAAGQIGVSGAALTYGGTVIGTIAGGAGNTLTVSFSEAATSAMVDATIEHLTYANSSSTPTTARTLVLNLTDGDGAALAGGAQSITVNTPSGAPAVAQNDAVSTDEATLLTGSLFADNGSGADSDADGPSPGVAAVNGSTADLGALIMLASGALLKVNLDGTFSYDPNGAFDDTPAAGSGAVNQPASDSFTYTLAGGATATVTVTIAGVDSDDLLTGTSAGETLQGGIGNDLLDGNGGSDLLLGGYGDDIYIVDSFDDYLAENAGWGTDEIRTALAGYSLAALANFENLRGTSASGQSLAGSDVANRITAGAGADTLYGAGGDDFLYGNGGSDTIFGADGNDYVEGGAGVDGVLGGIGDDVLHGGSEDDSLYGEDGADTLFGENNFDRLYGGSGGDSLYGGSGNDHLEGGADADLLFGEAGNDTMLGGDADDRLEGGDGADGLAGGLGADFLSGGNSGDWLFGEDGNDTILGDAGDDWIDGGAGADGLTGGLGADFMLGGIGGDFLLGGDGNDTLVGGDGDDNLKGEANDDVLVGGAGNDTLEGGPGRDQYVFNAALGAGNIDTIVGARFNGADDTILLDHSVFAALPLGALAPGAFVRAAAALDADDRIVLNPNTGLLYYDADGNGAGAAVQFATLSNSSFPVAADFIVI